MSPAFFLNQDIFLIGLFFAVRNPINQFAVAPSVLPKVATIKIKIGDKSLLRRIRKPTSEESGSTVAAKKEVTKRVKSEVT